MCQWGDVLCNEFSHNEHYCNFRVKRLSNKKSGHNPKISFQKIRVGGRSTSLSIGGGLRYDTVVSFTFYFLLFTFPFPLSPFPTNHQS